MSDSDTTAMLYRLLKEKYALPKFALVTEVPNATSTLKDRTADAMAFGCWQTAGMVVHGFEVKASRSDWMKELQDRSKAMAFERYVHQWWIVAAKGIVNIGELPAEWGLLEPAGSGLRVRSAASVRTPETMPMSMLSAIVRRAIGESPNEQQLHSEFERGRQYERDAAISRRERVGDAEMLMWKRRAESAEAAISHFKESSGVTIETWNGKHVGRCFSLFQAMRRGPLPANPTINELRSILDAFDNFKSHWNKENE